MACKCHDATFCPDMICIDMEGDQPIFARRDSEEARPAVEREAAMAAAKTDEDRIRLDEREKCARLLETLFHKMKVGAERYAIAVATSVIRRGRELTDQEKMANLFAAVDDKPSPFPQPRHAR